MTKIFLVAYFIDMGYGDGEGSGVVGVYSTMEKALEVVGNDEHYFIHEMTLDEFKESPTDIDDGFNPIVQQRIDEHKKMFGGKPFHISDILAMAHHPISFTSLKKDN